MNDFNLPNGISSLEPFKCETMITLSNTESVTQYFEMHNIKKLIGFFSYSERTYHQRSTTKRC